MSLEIMRCSAARVRIGLVAGVVLAGCTSGRRPEPQDESAQVEALAPAPIPAPVVPAEPVEAGQTEDAEAVAPPAPGGASFTVVARLVDAGQSVPHCGVLHFVVVMKFEVQAVVAGTFASKTLYAAVSCPEMPPTRAKDFAWTVGETYRLRLRTSGRRRGGALVDAFEAEPGARHDLLGIQPA